MTHRSLDELNAFEPTILSSPDDEARVTCLCYRPDFRERSFPDQLTLSPEHGVIGDRWEEHAWLRTPEDGPDPRVQIAIINSRLLDFIWDASGDQLHPGDTIAADLNLSESHLPVGTRLKAGTAIIEVSDIPNKGCAKWKARYGADIYRWSTDPAHADNHRRGIYCQIISGGVLKLNDKITRL